MAHYVRIPSSRLWVPQCLSPAEAGTVIIELIPGD
jgi:hypothetical protein